MTKKNLMVVANDLGYGQVKTTIDKKYMKQPSVIAEVSQVTSDPINHENEAAVENTVENLLDNMDVTIGKKRYLVGNAASNSTLPRNGFDINSGKGKANTDLSLILPLSFIAARKIQQVYEADEDIFEPLQADVVMATALPINEIGFGDSDHREEFANKFMNKKHIVIFNNFDTPISVTLNFKVVKVFKEGEVATAIAIKHGDQKLKKALIKDIVKNYPDYADVAEDLIDNASDVLGIDIGQGTTDLALTTKGKADVYNSVSIPEGYGTVLNRALKFLPRMSKGYVLPDVVSLTEILNKDTKNRIEEENKETALEAVQTSVPSLINRIQSAVNDALDANFNLEIIYVFGGGAIPLMKNTDLRKELATNLENKRSKAIIVYPGENYAQELNEIGLNMLAEELADSI